MSHQIMPETVFVIQRKRRRRSDSVYRFPSVAILMPFNPKMEMKNKLVRSLYKLTDKVIAELHEKYPGEMSSLLIQKLREIIKSLNFNTHKISLAIFVSPVFEKIYYLNIDLEEKVIVNESLQIRDLLYNKKRSRQFHIMLLNENESRIYLSDTHNSLRLTLDNLICKDNCHSKVSQRVKDSSHIAMENEPLLIKFLRQVDYSLDFIRKHDRLPVFVMGAEKILEQFKKITKHADAISEYVPGDYEKFSLEDIKMILKPHVADWKKIKQKNLLAQLKEAAGKNKLSSGMADVRHEVINRRGQLLLIEQNYLYNSDLCERNMPDGRTIKTYNKFSCIKNSIDEMIEKVLENGGDIELVNNGFLQDYSHIALIKD